MLACAVKQEHGAAPHHFVMQASENGQQKQHIERLDKDRLAALADVRWVGVRHAANMLARVVY
jgi:hypothetical protein